jgi:predicted permease
MNLFAPIRFWCRAMVNRSRIGREAEEEFKFHIDAYVADLIRQGIAPADAQRRARIDLGRADTQNEKYREAIGLRLFADICGDVRYGLRSLIRNPVFSILAVLSLTLGIGSTTAMFSVIYAALIRPYPYPDANRIMYPILINEQRPLEYRWFVLTQSQFLTFGRVRAIESLLGFSNRSLEITSGAIPENVGAVYLTENATTFFGIRPLLGRGIEPSDGLDGSPHSSVVVLNYEFWQRHYNADPTVLGHTLQLDHQNYSIVGVMPQSFAFAGGGHGDIYLPRSLLRNSLSPQVVPFYTPLIKLRSGVSLAAANSQFQAMLLQFAKETPEHFPKAFHAQVQSIVVPYEKNSRRTLGILFVAVVLLLFIGCVNCSVLLLARGAARQHELAVRSAVGASRSRIIRQLLVESLVFSCTGAIMGVVLSWWLGRLPLLLSPGFFPHESLHWVNLPILGFSVGLALSSGLFFGLTPAFRLSRPDLSQTMQSGVRRIGGQGGTHTLNGLVVSQIALTLVLLSATGTATGAFLRIINVPLGYDPHHVMDLGIVMHWNDPKEWDSYKSQSGRAAYIEQLREKIASIPGVLSVSVGTFATPPTSGMEFTFEISGHKSQVEEIARIHRVSPEYFPTLRVPLLEGRLWDKAENMRGDSVAVINETMARQYWPHQNPIGQQVRIPNLANTFPLIATSPDSGGWRKVIGVVGDVRNSGLSRPTASAIYLPYTTFMEPLADFQVRTHGEPLSLLHSVRFAVQSVSFDQQISNGAASLEHVLELDPDWSRQRLFSVLFGCFSGMALVIALIGLFSVVSYSVSQRTNEFGLRMALGARKFHILWVAMRTAILSVGAGITVGLLMNLLLYKLFSSWTGVGQQASSWELIAVTPLLAVIATVACLLPAGRAASVDPVEALHYE